MSGGMAYVYDPAGRFAERVNQDMVIYQRIEVEHYEHAAEGAADRCTTRTRRAGSPSAILADFDRELGQFWQVVPREMLDKLEVPVTRDDRRRRSPRRPCRAGCANSTRRGRAVAAARRRRSAMRKRGGAVAPPRR